MTKKLLFIITSCFLLKIITYPIYCIELTSSDISMIRVGIVDMDRILLEYPLAQKLEQNIQSFKEMKLVSLVEIDKEIDELTKKRIALKTEIEQIRSQLDKILPSSDIVSGEQSSTTVNNLLQDQQQTTAQQENIQQLNSDISNKQKNYDELNKTIEEKKEQLRRKKEEVEQEVARYREKVEAELYSELYSVIEDVAKKEKLNIVIDKSGILYGVPEIDITDKVLKMLK